MSQSFNKDPTENLKKPMCAKIKADPLRSKVKISVEQPKSKLEEYDLRCNPPSNKLIKIVAEMCACNGMKLKPICYWPVDIDFNFKLLNQQAESLPDDQISDFVDGDQVDALILAEHFEIHLLSSFLNSVFDGALSEKITS